METLINVGKMIGKVVDQIVEASGYVLDSADDLISATSWIPEELIALFGSAVVIIIALRVVGR